MAPKPEIKILKEITVSFFNLNNHSLWLIKILNEPNENGQFTTAFQMHDNEIVIRKLSIKQIATEIPITTSNGTTSNVIEKNREQFLKFLTFHTCNKNWINTFFTNLFFYLVQIPSQIKGEIVLWFSCKQGNVDCGVTKYTYLVSFLLILNSPK